MPLFTQNNRVRASLFLVIYTFTVLGAVAGIAYRSLRGESTQIIAMTDSFDLAPYTTITEDPS